MDPFPQDAGHLSAWLAAPPSTREQSQVLMELLDELLRLLSPYGADTVYTTEPRYYRVSSTGRKALARSIASGEIASLVVAAGLGGGQATARLDLGERGSQLLPTTLHISITPDSGADALAGAATGLCDLTVRWFACLGAVSAFVS